jgi:hypothetical protein
MSFLDRFKNTDSPATNEYGVIPVLFHTDCNMVGEHGTVLVSCRKKGIRNAVVSFHLKNCAEAPAFTPKLFLELEAAAESQGYVLHELVSYERLRPMDSGLQEHLEGLEQRHVQAHRMPTTLDPFEAARTMTMVSQPSGAGTLRHNEFSGSAGAALLSRTGVIPRTENREPFDLHSLNRSVDAKVPAYMRRPATQPVDTKHAALVRMDAQIADLVEKDSRAWILSREKVDLHYAHLPEDRREELVVVATLTAAKMIADPAKHEALLVQLAELAHRFDSMESELSAEAAK